MLQLLSILLLVGVAAADERHKPGDVWPKGDGCNTCEMDQFGTSSCTVMYCKLQDIYTDCLHKTPYGETIDICRTPDMRKILSESQSCEIKMKEAMRIAKKHQGDLWSPFHITTTAYSGAYSGMRCVTVECLQKELDAAKAAEKEAADLKQAKIRWDAIYQECVK